jgi:hypothetical protein
MAESDQHPLTVELLVKSGFSSSGNWTLLKGNLSLPANLPTRPGVYAFCMDDRVQYVGLATQSIRKRLYFYAKPGPSQPTNTRLNAMLRTLLAEGCEIRILTAHPEDCEWNGLRVCGPSGLEAGIIKTFDLPWNKRGTAVAKSTTLRPRSQESANKQGSPSGSSSIAQAIVAHVIAHPGVTEREIAQALFGRQANQQRVNSHCRELVRKGLIERMPTSPLTYRIGQAARTASLDSDLRESAKR